MSKYTAKYTVHSKIHAKDANRVTRGQNIAHVYETINNIHRRGQKLHREGSLLFAGFAGQAGQS